MNEKLLKLAESIEKDEKKICDLQATIAAKKIKMKEISNADILRDVHILEANGVQIREVLEAIKSNDTETLLKYTSINKSKEIKSEIKSDEPYFDEKSKN